MSFGQRMTRAALMIARILMPRSHRSWADAMKAEAAEAEAGLPMIEFAVGCMWAALRTRLSQTIQSSPTEFRVGAAIGTIFLVHATLPDSRSWPWLWPAFGGVLIGAIEAQKRDASSWQPVAAGLKTGIACGAFFFVGGITVVAASAFHLDWEAIRRGAGLIAYGAFGSVLASTLWAAATSAVASRLG